MIDHCRLQNSLAIQNPIHSNKINSSIDAGEHYGEYSDRPSLLSFYAIIKQNSPLNHISVLFDLHISAKQRNWLIDERSSGVGFNEFQQNAGQSNRSSREENGRSHFEDQKRQEHEERKKRTPSARATHAEWHEILQVAPDSSKEVIHRAYLLRMNEYHPDKVAHLGEKLRHLAEQESKEINAAYEEASRQRQGR